MFRNVSLPSLKVIFDVKEDEKVHEQSDFPNNSTGHIPLEASLKYGEGRKKVRHQYSYYPVHEIKPVQQYLLEIVGQDTELYGTLPAMHSTTTSSHTFITLPLLLTHSPTYFFFTLGESYTFNGRTLQFSGSYIPKNLRHDNQVLLFGSSAGTEVYLPGVGLPGNCFTEGGFQFHTLENLVKDPFYNTGGIRLQSASNIFHGAITIALDHATINTSSASSRFNNIRIPNVNCLGVIIVYSSKPVYRSASFAAYLNSVRAIADGLSSLMSQRAFFKKGTNNRLERNLRIFRLSILFISHFVTSYHKKYKQKPTLDVTIPSLPRTGSMSFFVTTQDIDDIHLSPRDEEAARGLSKHDSSRHSKSNHDRRAATDISEHRDKKYNVRDQEMFPGPPSPVVMWIQDYFKKFMGGKVHMPVRMLWTEGMITFLGVFVAVSSVMLFFSLTNESTPEALTLPASFGALSTLLYALPAAPLAQVISHFF